MSVEGFRSEWFTAGKHRVYLEARASFPDDDHRFIATVVAKTLDHNSSSARLVKVFSMTKHAFMESMWLRRRNQIRHWRTE